MHKEIILKLDEKTHDRLSTLCNGNEECIKDYIIKTLENQLALECGKETLSLEDYLKSGTPGSRAYGIKGQGW
jgi:hypothetical protein